MSSIRSIMDAMADAIRDAIATEYDDVQVEPRMILNPTTQAIDMMPGSVAVDRQSAGFIAAGHDGAMRYDIRAHVSPNDHEANQEFLLDLMDDESDLSIAIALDDDPTLDGTVTSIEIENVSGYTMIPSYDGSSMHLGCIWTVLVIPARS